MEQRVLLGRIATLLAALMVALGFFAYSLRFLDGPILVLNGGPLESGELVEYDDVDWTALDGLRELELELTRTGRSRVMWFSVYEGRPYISCGFGCEGGWAKRWPHHVDRDPRVVVRVGGVRVRGRAERVVHGSAEYVAAREARRWKLGNGGGIRETTELEAAAAVVRLGSELTGESDAEAPTGRLYRIVAPR